MHALIAFDKFKDSLTAHKTCKITRETLQELHPNWTVETAPLADGGDGFCDVLTLQADGLFLQTNVTGPQGIQTPAKIGFVSRSEIPDPALELLDIDSSCQKIAIIEMAQSSGIALVPQENRSPWKATTAGLGELIKFAKSEGAHCCVIGLGGSATHDLGIGALQALGFELCGDSDQPLSHIPYPETWKDIQSIAAPVAPLGMAIRIACDVENPLLGTQGAAAIFGPQKGLIPEEFNELESETERIARLLLATTQADEQALSLPGTGAAGGAAFGLLVGLGGKIVAGFSLVKEWIELEPKLLRSDIVITGEGRFDASSLQGKGPGSLVKDASNYGKPSYVFAGSLGELEQKKIPNAQLIAISPTSLDLKEALKQTEPNLIGAIQRQFQTPLPL